MAKMKLCVRPIVLAYRGLDENQVLEKLRTTDLRETCGYVGVVRLELIDKWINTVLCRMFTVYSVMLSWVDESMGHHIRMSHMGHGFVGL